MFLLLRGFFCFQDDAFHQGRQRLSLNRFVERSEILVERNVLASLRLGDGPVLATDFVMERYEIGERGLLEAVPRVFDEYPVQKVHRDEILFVMVIQEFLERPFLQDEVAERRERNGFARDFLSLNVDKSEGFLLLSFIDVLFEGRPRVKGIRGRGIGFMDVAKGDVIEGPK